MASKSDKGKRKEKEFDVEKVRQLSTWDGRFQEGKSNKWFCKCDGYSREANCRTVKNPSSEDFGKKCKLICPRPELSSLTRSKVWRCSKQPGDQCRFYLKTDEEDEAKEWMSKYGVPAPEEPVTPNLKPKAKGDPWSHSKGAVSKLKTLSRQPSDEDGNAGPSKRSIDDGELSGFEDIDLSRKVAKTSRASTPGRTSKEVLEVAAASLLTPETAKSKVATRSRQSKDSSPPPELAPAIEFDNERSNTTAAVLKLLEEEDIELKESTKILIGDLIDRALDSNDAKVKRYEKTISRLSEKLDEKERSLDEKEVELDKMGQMLLSIGGVDEPIDLSD